MITENETMKCPTDEEIATHAYTLWESDGRQEGRDLDYWLQAKAQLMAKQKSGGQQSNGQSIPRSQMDTRRDGSASAVNASPNDKGNKKRKPENRPSATRQPVIA